MAQNRKYVVSIPATITFHVQKTGEGVTQDDDIFGGIVKFDSATVESVVIFEWDLSTNATSFIGSGPGSAVVTKIELEYYHFQADTGTLGPAGDWDIKFDEAEVGNQPSTRTAEQKFSDLTASTTTITDTVKGDQKTIRRVTVGDGVTADVNVLLSSRFLAANWFALGIQKTDTVQGQMEVGGLVLAKGIDTLWQAATGDFEHNGPPNLIVTVEQTQDNHIQHIMRYTTADPTTTQATPSNSVGGYVASNSPYTRAQISNVVSSSQTTIPISTSSPSALPTVTGLAQLGPEIFKFAGIDTTNEQLTSVIRGISPPFSYPAAMSPFAEYIHYLVIDNLFDRRPNASLIQYRCVAIEHSVTDATQTARNTRVILVQDPDAEVQVDIGIEVPKHDYIGSVTLAALISEGSSILTSSDGGWSEFTDDFFVGSHIVVDPDVSGSGPQNAIIESFTVTAGVAEFIVDVALLAYASGEDFEIRPAPCQTISNESIAPTENSGRFLGFFQEGGSDDISFGGIRRREGQMRDNDAIYIWIKRILQDKKKSKADTGAVIITLFDDIDLS